MLSIGFLYSYNLHYPKSEVFFLSSFFHDFVILGLFFMVVFVSIMFYYSMSSTKAVKSKKSLEVYLMGFPIMFLLILSVPSMMLLQKKGGFSSMSEEVYVDASQWFWEYTTGSLPNFVSSLCFSCSDTWYKLEPNMPLHLSVGTKNFFFSSNDVLHSFALPSMGVKVDCVPGLLVSLETKILSPGMFYGQCSELCGVNHSFMPIEVEVSSVFNAM